MEGYTGFLSSCIVCRIGVKPYTPLITVWSHCDTSAFSKIHQAPTAHLAPVPLTLFRLNSKFNQNLECSSLKYAWQRNFAHIMTVTLWRDQKFVVIGWVYFKLENCKFWWNLEFDRNSVSGTGACKGEMEMGVSCEFRILSACNLCVCVMH